VLGKFYNDTDDYIDMIMNFTRSVHTMSICWISEKCLCEISEILIVMSMTEN